MTTDRLGNQYGGYHGPAVDISQLPKVPKGSATKMTLDEIIDQCLADSHVWFPGNAEDLPFMTLATFGELGEFSNYVKKVERGTHSPSQVREGLEEEATDTFIYLMNIIGMLREQGFDLVQAYQAKRAKNVQRFGGANL